LAAQDMAMALLDFVSSWSDDCSAVRLFPLKSRPPIEEKPNLVSIPIKEADIFIVFFFDKTQWAVNLALSTLQE
jgi:hypothetical protein